MYIYLISRNTISINYLISVNRYAYVKVETGIFFFLKRKNRNKDLSKTDIYIPLPILRIKKCPFS